MAPREKVQTSCTKQGRSFRMFFQPQRSNQQPCCCHAATNLHWNVKNSRHVATCLILLCLDTQLKHQARSSIGKLRPGGHLNCLIRPAELEEIILISNKIAEFPLFVQCFKSKFNKEPNTVGLQTLFFYCNALFIKKKNAKGHIFHPSDNIDLILVANIFTMSCGVSLFPL